jgi:pimeloyl-ACP methyl ester carboxylesterase
VSQSWQEHEIRHGELCLAVRSTGALDGLPVLALHGWRDNAATFEPLAAELPELRIHALDLAGHGRSSWRHREGGYYIWSYLDEVLAVADALALTRFTLLGHSMGGAVACLLAALYPERCERLLLLDSLGPLATPPEDAPGQMRRALDQQRSLKASFKQRYASFEAAVQARADKGLGFEAAAVLGHRSIREDANGWYWSTDPRLALANPVSLAEAQIAAFMQGITCPALLVAAPEFWQSRQQMFERRCTYIAGLQVETLPGNHHQHLEGQVEAVAAHCRRFLGI